MNFKEFLKELYDKVSDEQLWDFYKCNVANMKEQLSYEDYKAKIKKAAMPKQKLIATYKENKELEKNTNNILNSIKPQK